MFKREEYIKLMNNHRHFCLNNNNTSILPEYKHAIKDLKATNLRFQNNDRNYMEIYTKITLEEEKIVPNVEDSIKNLKHGQEVLENLHKSIDEKRMKSLELNNQINEKMIGLSENISLLELQESQIAGEEKVVELMNVDKIEPLDEKVGTLYLDDDQELQLFTS